MLAGDLVEALANRHAVYFKPETPQVRAQLVVAMNGPEWSAAMV
jgi:hypothetical protein